MVRRSNALHTSARRMYAGSPSLKTTSRSTMVRISLGSYNSRKCQQLHQSSILNNHWFWFKFLHLTFKIGGMSGGYLERGKKERKVICHIFGTFMKDCICVRVIEVNTNPHFSLFSGVVVFFPWCLTLKQ